MSDRRLVLALGALAALVLGLVAAFGLRGPETSDKSAPPASKGGLVVESGRDDDERLDPARPLRCFVSGQFVGELTLADCAQRNGVATGALDVGIDESGALAAAQEPGELFAPLPPGETPKAPESAASPETPVSAPAQGGEAAAPCLRYADGGWRAIPGNLGLSSCVQVLFAGRCERAGSATYGRWGDQTLRLVPGRVEVSGDNRSFRTLVEQSASCAIPAIG